MSTSDSVRAQASDLTAQGYQTDLSGNSPPEVVANLIDHAVRLGASDVFLSTDEHVCSVSIRHLGVVRPVGLMASDFGRHCIAHLRAEAGLDIAEHRKPQDGRYAYVTGTGKTIDLRVCSLATLYGEDIAVRILDRETSLLHLDRIGLSTSDRNHLERLLSYPGGLILVTGPTGSGKTTTLYACLQHLNVSQRRIHTIEDPIEYAVRGVRQSQPNAKHGIHFSDVLRGIVRQGPDVIMVGEIRDPETAHTAVSASNSGHLVLATLHAPLAAGGVASMLAFGVAPHFLASSLIGVISQRLVRTFCPECRFPVEDAQLSDASTQRRYRALGCPVCHYTGFGGRTALMEIMEVTRPIRELIQSREPAQVIEEQAYREGMSGFLQSAKALVAIGSTDFAEVQRCIPPDCLRGEEKV